MKTEWAIRSLLLLLAISAGIAQSTYAKHILFISGEDSHGDGQHQRFATCNLLMACLKNVDPEITTKLYYLPDDGWPSQAVIDSADTIFINSLGYGGSIVNNASRLSQLEAHMDSGGGLCSMSWSLAVNGTLADRWINLIGANWYNSNQVALFYSQAFYKPATGLAHPIMRGVSDYGLNDEIFFNYNRAPATEGNLIPLLVHNATNAPYYGTGIRGNADAKAKTAAGFEFLASWAFERASGGRAFAHSCGRYNYNFAKDSYRKNMINGIMWTLGEDIPSDGYTSLTPGTDAILRHMPTASYWDARTASLQRMLNYNQEHMMPWRKDDSNNNEVVVGTSYMARIYTDIPASITSDAPDPELNYDDPRNPANYPVNLGHEVSFLKTKLSADYLTEGAAIADMDGDGVNDLIGGPAWWKGPELTQGYSYKPVIHTQFLHDDGTPIGFSEAPDGALSLYTQDFFVFPVDVDGDQWTDLITVARQGEAGEWYSNPALNSYTANNTTDEKSHFEYQNEVNCESPIFVDVIGDSQKELISFTDNKVTITTPSNSTGAWTKRTISETSSALYRRNHGLGAGDINGDGLVDIIVNHGWYEQPAELDSKTVWDFQAYSFADSAAQIQVYDVDGDGDNDVVTALKAHGYGMAWYEHYADAGAPGGIGFTPHLIMPENAITDPSQSPSGISFCQLHAMESADIDGDGVKDIVTGKCYLAHNGRDADWDGAPVLYWFKTRRNADGSVDFVPHLIDDDSGVGRQISIGDINGDGRLDIATGNKKGVYAFIQKCRRAAFSGMGE